MNKDAWRKLDPDETDSFLKAVTSPDEPAIFQRELCEVYALPLSFYDGYSLYRIGNKHMMPYLVLDFLSNGENHYYLDGSDQAFHNLNAQGAISLDTNNVPFYVDMYITYVYERGNSLVFVSDPHRMTYKGSGSMEMHFNAIKHHQSASVSFDEASKRFHLKTPLIYKDETVGGVIEVETGGAIHVIEPVKVSFLAELNPTETIPYRHPNEEQIVQQAKDLLSNSDTGQRLLKWGEENQTSVRVLTSPSYQGFTTNHGGIYLTMPAAEKNAKYLQALMLAYALRDAEQVKAGYLRPPPEAGQALTAPINFGKNLDMIVETCKIVTEFEAKQIPEPLNELRKMGLESVYAGFKKGLEWDDLMELYIQSLERYGMIGDA